MKMKFGAIVVDGRNKIGGHVASKNRAGNYLRTKVTPANPRTASQLAVRNRFTGLSQAWKGLAAAVVASWNNAVSAWKRTDIFGDLRNPTGLNLYQRLNNNLLNIGVAALTNPPAPGSVAAFTSFSATAVHAGAVTLTFAAAIAATEKVLVRATPPQSGGKSFVKSEYRQIMVLSSTDTSPKIVTTEYNAKFGNPGSAGQKIFFELVQISVATGQAGTPIAAVAVVS
jgi:hypothetical protein